MPGRLLPPHQTCPLPLLSFCLTLTMIHTQHESSSRLFFCPVCFRLTLSNYRLQTVTCLPVGAQACEHICNLLLTEHLSSRTLMQVTFPGSKLQWETGQSPLSNYSSVLLAFLKLSPNIHRRVCGSLNKCSR